MTKHSRNIYLPMLLSIPLLLTTSPAHAQTSLSISCTSTTGNGTCTASVGAPWTNTPLHWQATDVSMTILNNTSVSFSCVANFHPGHISVMPSISDGNTNIPTVATIQLSC
ncbi:MULTISPECIES: hypothetical protein [unclassified Burkholderia]|nr:MULTISPECIES: hypothetical protein [unclassified Burkholderia]